MLDKASSYQRDVAVGRWAILTRHHRRSWKVIVEPDQHMRILVVVTAYPIESE